VRILASGYNVKKSGEECRSRGGQEVSGVRRNEVGRGKDDAESESSKRQKIM
jgi:hypothetical protein